jgi:hypothetical protein
LPSFAPESVDSARSEITCSTSWFHRADGVVPVAVKPAWFEFHKGEFDSRIHRENPKAAKRRDKTKQEIEQIADLMVDGIKSVNLIRSAP